MRVSKEIQTCNQHCFLFFNFLCAKDIYICPVCTLHATTVHAFRLHQGCIFTSLAVGKKLFGLQRVNKKKG